MMQNGVLTPTLGWPMETRKVRSWDSLTHMVGMGRQNSSLGKKGLLFQKKARLWAKQCIAIQSSAINAGSGSARSNNCKSRIKPSEDNRITSEVIHAGMDMVFLAGLPQLASLWYHLSITGLLLGLPASPAWESLEDRDCARIHSNIPTPPLGTGKWSVVLGPFVALQTSL